MTSINVQHQTPCGERPDWIGSQPSWESVWRLVNRLVNSPIYELVERWNTIEYVHNKYQNWLVVTPSDREDVEVVISVSDQMLFLNLGDPVEADYWDLTDWDGLKERFEEVYRVGGC